MMDKYCPIVKPKARYQSWGSGSLINSIKNLKNEYQIRNNGQIIFMFFVFFQTRNSIKNRIRPSKNASSKGEGKYDFSQISTASGQ